MAAMTVSAVAVAGVVTGVAVLVRAQRTQAIEFAGAPLTTTEASTSQRPAPESEPEPQPEPGDRGSESVAAARPSPPAERSEPPPKPDRTTPQPASSACAGSKGASDVPASANAKQIVDVDGDDRPDVMWLDRRRTLGIITAAGDAATLQIKSAAPSRIGALAADADRRPPVELFVSDGRTVQLFVFDDCRIRPVINTRDGEPWLFRGKGTGVGCVNIAGKRRLVGLNSKKHGRDTVEWSRTAISLDGRSATAGHTDEGSFKTPEHDDAIERLSEITCGDLTMVDDGVQTPAPQ